MEFEPEGVDFDDDYLSLREQNIFVLAGFAEACIKPREIASNGVRLETALIHSELRKALNA